MDWRASARTGHTQMRVFTEERDRPTLIVVNLTSATFFGTQVRSFMMAVANALGGP